MQTTLSHIQFNVDAGNVPYYQKLMTFLGWQVAAEGEGYAGFEAQGVSVWFLGGANDARNDYDGPGMNHLAVGAASPANVDTAAAYLREQGTELLFNTPCHRPEFCSTEDDTYYQVMFETPDRILLEVVYAGPKAA